MELDRGRDWVLLHHVVRELRELCDDALAELGLERSWLDDLRTQLRAGFSHPPAAGGPATLVIRREVAAVLAPAIGYLVGFLGDGEVGHRTSYTVEDFRAFANRVAADAV